MAENKKGFILYSDLIHTVEKMPDDKAGLLLKHILRYVNDLEPVTDDLIIQLTFEPIRQQLKRDLSKWDEIRSKRSEAGKRSAEIRKKKKKQIQQVSTSVESVKQVSTKSTVSVNDTVNVNVNDIVINKDKETIFYNWLEYRKEIKKPIKAKKTLTSLISQFNNATLKECEFVVNNSINNQWTGLFWDKYNEGRTSKIEVAKNAGLEAAQMLRNEAEAKNLTQQHSNELPL